MPKKKTALPAGRVVRRQIDVARFFERSLDAVKSWAKQDMPGTAGGYDLLRVAEWLYTRGPWKPPPPPPPPPDDPLLSGEGDSPGLERYRQAKAALAEMELERQRHNLLPREQVRGGVLRLASILRRAGGQLGKQHGPAAAAVLNEALEEFHRLVEREYADDPDHDDDPRAGDDSPPAAA